MSVCQSVLIVVLWAGMTIWEIFSGGKAPYPGTDPHTLIHSLEEGYWMSWPYNDTCNEEMLAEIISRLFYSLGKCPLFIYSAWHNEALLADGYTRR